MRSVHANLITDANQIQSSKGSKPALSYLISYIKRNGAWCLPISMHTKYFCMISILGEIKSNMNKNLKTGWLTTWDFDVHLCQNEANRTLPGKNFTSNLRWVNFTLLPVDSDKSTILDFRRDVSTSNQHTVSPRIWSNQHINTNSIRTTNGDQNFSAARNKYHS